MAVRRRFTLAMLAAAVLGVLGLGNTAVGVAVAPTAHATNSTASGGSPLRLLQWSGRLWIVVSPDSPGPHGDPASNTTESAHVDSHGRLHLHVYKSGGVWRSVQLESFNPISYGTYSFVTDTSVASLAKPLDFAMYVFRSGTKHLTNEIDLENGRSLLGMHHGRTSQFVVQPYNKPHHLKHYAITAPEKLTRQQFTWNHNRVHFVTRSGSSRHGRVISTFNFHGTDVPTSDGMHVYLDLFLHNMPHHPNVGHGAKTAIVDSFTLTPSK